MKYILHIATLILTTYSTFSFGQRDTINQLNTKGKKVGYWKQFLDEKCDPTDSANAYFYGYELYDNGTYVWKFHKHEKVADEGVKTYQGKLPEKGKPELLNGTFKTYYTYGLLSEEETFKDGHPLYLNSFLRYKKDPEKIVLRQEFFFDKLYNNIPGTYYYQEYDNGVLNRTYWYYKGKKGWKCYRIKKD